MNNIHKITGELQASARHIKGQDHVPMTQAMGLSAKFLICGSKLTTPINSPIKIDGFAWL